MHRASLVVACTVLLAAAPLAAQTAAAPASSTKGFFLGAHLGGSAITVDELSDEQESGSGAGLQIGYGFTRQLALVVEGTGAALDTDGGTLGLGHFDIGLRYAFTSPTRRFVPFVDVAFSGRALGQDDADLGDGTTGDITISGAGLSFGGGAQYYFAPRWAVGAGVKWTAGEFSQVKVDNVSVDGLEIDATSARVNLGITWYPMAGR